MTLVVDASITLAWLFGDEATAGTWALLDRARAEGMAQPTVWPFEVSNVLALAERRKRVSSAQIATFIDLLAGLPVEFDGESRQRALSDTLTLARAERLTAYDAAYLELAGRLRVPLATRDRDLIAAAGRTGVAILTG